MPQYLLQLGIVEVGTFVTYEDSWNPKLGKYILFQKLDDRLGIILWSSYNFYLFRHIINNNQDVLIPIRR